MWKVSRILFEDYLKLGLLAGEHGTKTKLLEFLPCFI